MKIKFKNGVLDISSLYCYSTASDAVSAAADNIGKEVSATKSWQVYDCVGPSWAHSVDISNHECRAKITGEFTREEIQSLFKDGWWYEAAKKQGKRFEKACCYGGKSYIEVQPAL